MAIPLGHPVEDITHGLESIKIDGHTRDPEKTEVQNGSALSPPDVGIVQAHHVGHEHSGGEIAERSDASGLEQGSLGVPSGAEHLYAENPGVEYVHPGVEHVVFGSEQFAQHPYVGAAPIPLQAPIHTGYPAPIMNLYGYYPYQMDAGAYNSSFVDYTHVYNQNYYYSVPGAAPYSMGYSAPYGYPQHQVAPVEHYNATTINAPVNGEGAMVPELQLQDPAAFAPYGYPFMNPHVGHGQWAPMTMVLPTPAVGESSPNISALTYTDPWAPVLSNLQPSAWVPQLEGPKGLNDGYESKSVQQSRIQSDIGLHPSNLQKIDSKVPSGDNKKLFKKQLGFFYGPALPMKESWVRSGHSHCISTAQPMKNVNAKAKSSGIRLSNAEPLVKAEVNLESFSLDFEDAKHFVIKSFSEENIARSIQHGVWASTPNGNKKLDEAFHDAQGRALGKARGCPVFLYFSVNGSGRFCGVAEMVGRVDYNNTMDFWERNRWCGSFPLKWHFIKDVPHSQLRRIILQNNENKPVTSSRDTQEVNFEQGLQMLCTIKNYSTRASILDNFPTPQIVVPADVIVEQLAPVESRDEANSVVDKETRQEVQQDCNATAPENSNALRASNSEAKARDTQLQGRSKVDTPNQGATGESGGRNADKENVMVLNVSPMGGGAA